MSKIDFLKTGIQNIKTVGAVTRSSRYLCKKVISFIDFKKATTLVEFGAGDGVITRHILRQMRPDAKLLAFEIVPELVERLKKIQDPRLIIIEDSAEYLKKYLQENGVTQADHIISAIPLTNLPKPLTTAILTACRDNLPVGGSYNQVHYSLAAKKIYEEVFGNVSTHFVALNVPPAWVLRSEKA